MTDKELLELAAKAAGIQQQWNTVWRGMYLRKENDEEGWDITSYWNPLTDDGDALRLAVELEIDITHAYGTRTVSAYNTNGYAAEGSDPYSATRRAIVRAAAEIGKKK